MTVDFSDISYLAGGNKRQRRCHELLVQTRIMEILAPYGPLLVGTIPIGIDTAQSDLDIVCEVRDATSFADVIDINFGKYEDYNIRFCDGGRVVCTFSYGGEKFEVYGSPVLSAQGEGWRHMLVESRLLNVMGAGFRDEIVALKNAGMKTEPAFAQVLGLKGDPYLAMLSLENRTDEQLAGLSPSKL